jgi:hypothetical protein
MPFQTIPGTSEQYALLSYNKDGKERRNDPDGVDGALSKTVLSRIAAIEPSHIFFFSHGWKGDLASARDQYDSWIKAMLDLRADRNAVPGTFRPMWVGLHWPSLPFGDEELGSNDFDIDEGGLSPDQLRAIYVDRLGLDTDAAPLLDIIIQAHQKNAAATDLPPEASRAYKKLAVSVGYQSDGPSGPPDAEGAPFDPDGAFQRGNDASVGTDFAGGGGILGGILGPMRQLSYWTMKKRARIIGESGMHAFVTDLMNTAPRARIHLMGHSFGAIVVSGILGGPDGSHPLPRQVDSVALIQGAVSLWAFGEHVQDKLLKGYFNRCVRRPAIRGPLLVSRSIHDRAVGILYPWASALSFSDGSFDVDDEDLPLYGAIGKYGIRALPGVVFRDMLDENGLYGFEAGKVYNLEASRFIAKGGGISGAHSDIDGPQVAHALWQAALV